MRVYLSFLWIAFAAAAFAGPATAQPLFSTRVGTGFTGPLFAASPPGDPARLFVAQRNGLVRRFDPATGIIDLTPVLNLATVPQANFVPDGGDRGFLGMTFDPDFATNGFLYVNYSTGTNDTAFSRLERYTYNFTTRTADPATRQVILQFDQPGLFHNSNWIGFHPTNRLLYIFSGSGDLNDPTNRGQALDTWFGKVLRIDPTADAFPTDPNRNYTVPPTNPFVGTPGVRPEIFAYGLRNPWRGSFDRSTGNLYLGDVGQATREEVNFIPSAGPGGQNFGWATREGTIGPPLPGSTDPIYEYNHTSGTGDPNLEGNSVTGGYVYRGPLLDGGQLLDGTYFFADFVTARIWSFRFDGTTRTDFRDRTGALRIAANGGTIDNPASFAEDGFGNLYLLDFGGEIFRISGTPVPEPATWALTAAAAGACWFWRRQRTGKGHGDHAGLGKSILVSELRR